MMKSSQTPQPKQHISSSVLLLVVGAALILFSIAVMLGLGWQELSTLGKIAGTGIPLLIMYGLAFASRRHPTYSILAPYLFVIASLILPFVVGELVYQVGYGQADNTWYFITPPLILLVLYSLLEFWAELPGHAYFVVISLIFAAVDLGKLKDLGSFWQVAIAIVTGLVLLIVGELMRQAEAKQEAPIYTVAGFITLLAGILLLPTSVVSYVISWIPDRLIISIGNVLISALLLGIAVYFAQQWKKHADDITAYRLRLVAENVAAITLVLPGLNIAVNQISLSNDIIVLALGILALIVSYLIRVRLFRIMGYIGALFGLLHIPVRYLFGLGFSWPLLLLVIGFLLIALAFFVLNVQSREKLNILWSTSNSSMYGLGKDLPANYPQKALPSWQLLALIILFFILMNVFI
jgi:hypothetical protein